MIIFIILMVLYVIVLAIVDSLVNRLIFREYSKLSYYSGKKEKIYKRKEWIMYCFLFLVFLPIIFPVGLSFLIGGFKYVLVYILILSIIDWDIIFGKIVFNKWFGDLPSICLPKIGWVHFNILSTILVRIVIASISIYFLML